MRKVFGRLSRVTFLLVMIVALFGCTKAREIATQKIDGGSRIYSDDTPEKVSDAFQRYFAGTGYNEIKKQKAEDGVITITAYQEPESPETKINVQANIFPDGKGSEGFLVYREDYYREACDKTTNFFFVLNGKCEWFRYGTKIVRDDRKFYTQVFEGIDAVKLDIRARAEGKSVVKSTAKKGKSVAASIPAVRPAAKKLFGD
jgi:hypothetical protein